METSELIGAFLGAVLTIMVLSYLIGDNPLFRLAMHLLIGVAGGYAGAVAIRNVLIPGFATPISQAERIFQVDLIVSVGLPLLLVLLLLLKMSPVMTAYGTPSMAFLVGVGAAVAVGGAITGTLIPQTLAATQSLSPNAISPNTQLTGLERSLSFLIMLVGTLATLFYFRFTLLQGNGDGQGASIGAVRLPGLVDLLSSVGKGFIAITFGVMYAGALAAALIVLSERMQFIWATFNEILGQFG